jgi:hypothetical protein
VANVRWGERRITLHQRLFLMKILDVAGVKYGVRTSEAIRSLGWRLARWKPH